PPSPRRRAANSSAPSPRRETAPAPAARPRGRRGARWRGAGRTISSEPPDLARRLAAVAARVEGNRGLTGPINLLYAPNRHPDESQDPLALGCGRSLPRSLNGSRLSSG